MYRAFLLGAGAAVLLGLSTAVGADLDGIRGTTPITAEPAVPPLSPDVADNELRPRSSHEQPPVIPHPVRDYRIDASINECLSCHGRTRTAQFPAAPISIAHYVDRSGRVSDSLAPGRYFCTQCHVPQTEASPLIDNRYEVLTIVPRRRYLCTGCHLPQTGLSAAAGSTSSDRHDPAR
jgi:nitrate reductase (cytochrome), electron transfer subunit